MQVNRVGSRGYVFTFDELMNTEFQCTTNVYLIDGNKYIFICDTFLGPKYMKEIKRFIYNNLNNKPIIIFNSHADWDHIWGNCFFKDNFIVSNIRCRTNIESQGWYELLKYKNLHEDDVKIVLPNLTFEDRIYFHEDEVEFFYSPGHTECSSSCLDRKDNILFTGDNIEYPVPYVQWDNLFKYKVTLERYLEINAKVIIPGHGDITDNELVKQNLEYIRNIK